MGKSVHRVHQATLLRALKMLWLKNTWNMDDRDRGSTELHLSTTFSRPHCLEPSKLTAWKRGNMDAGVALGMVLEHVGY
jgi:hypothetical protein